METTKKNLREPIVPVSAKLNIGIPDILMVLTGTIANDFVKSDILS